MVVEHELVHDATVAEGSKLKVYPLGSPATVDVLGVSVMALGSTVEGLTGAIVKLNCAARPGIIVTGPLAVEIAKSAMVSVKTGLTLSASGRKFVSPE
jgi:hypothetical protein